jgi:SAM-dependent methyltransferase
MPTSDFATNRYGSLAAEIYDLDKPFGALPDTAFHLETLSAVRGPILEPACGSGRTLAPLLEAGHDVSGFDASEEMLARCRARCAARGFDPPLARMRFENFVYDTRFEAILVPVGSFTLIDDFAVALSVLRRFHEHLVPHGLVILDIQPLSFLAGRGEDRRSWRAENGDLLTCEGERVATDWMNQTAQTRYRYERWRDHKLIACEIDPMSQRYWGRAEFELALRATGFTDIAVAGDYRRGQALRPTDRAMTFMARRRAA